MRESSVYYFERFDINARVRPDVTHVLGVVFPPPMDT